MAAPQPKRWPKQDPMLDPGPRYKDMEEAVLSDLFSNPDQAGPAYDGLPAEAFYDGCLRRHYEQMIGQIREGEFDPVSYAVSLNGDKTQFVQMVDRHYWQGESAARARVRKLCGMADVRRQLEYHKKHILRPGEDHEAPLPLAMPARDSVRLATDALRLITERREKDGQGFGLKTRFPRFDVETGGIEPGIIGAVAGPPGVGKSSFLWQLLCQIVDNNPRCHGIYIALEMSAVDLVIWALARLSGIPANLIRRGVGYDFEKLAPSMGAYRERHAPRIHIADRSQIAPTVTDIERVVGDVVRQHKPDALMVVVDYLQLLEGDGQEKRLEVDANVARLIGLAQRFNAAVWIASSLKRGSYDQPGLDSFKESGGIEFAAPVAITMRRENAENRFKPVEEIIVAAQKVRFGPMWQLKFAFEKPISRFREVGEHAG